MRLTPLLLLSALLACSGAPAVAAGGGQTEPHTEVRNEALRLPVDPNILTGELSNGLRFAVYPVPNSENDKGVDVAFVLHIAAGSAHEADDQIGAARIAADLKASGLIAPDTVNFEKTLSALGVDSRSGLRSSASYTATRFSLSIPVEAEGGLSSADVSRAMELLAALIAPGDGAIDDDDVTTARNGLLADQRAWSGPSQRITARALPSLFGDSVFAERVPIYSPESLEATDAKAIRAYTAAWYSPRRTTLVVVGPVDREVVRRAIEKAFGPLAPGHASDGPDLALSRPAHGRVLVEHDPGVVGDVIQLMLIEDPAPPVVCTGALQNQMSELVAKTALNRRLETLSQSPNAAILQGGAFTNADAGGYRMTMLNVAGESGEWERLTREAVASLNSAQTLGFTDREIAAAKDRVRQEIEAQTVSAEQLSNSSRASDLAVKLSRGDALIDPQQHRQVALTSLSLLDRNGVSETLRRMFPIDSMSTLVVSGSQVPKPEAVGQQIAIARSLDAKHIAESAPMPPDGPLFGPIDGTGSVRDLRHNPSTRVTTATLASGVSVHHKPLNPGSGRVSIAAAIALPTLTQDPVARAELAAISALQWQPATSAHPSGRLVRAIADRDLDLTIRTHPESIVIEVDTSREHFDFAMQFLTELLRSARVEPAALDRWRVHALQSDAASQTEPNRAALRAFENCVAPAYAERAGELDGESIKAISVTSVQSRLDSLLREAPLTVAIAGDLDRPTALRVSAALLSDLSERKPAAPIGAEQRTILTPNGPTDIRLEQNLASESAAVTVGFLSADTAAVTDSVALDIAASVLQERLVERFKRDRIPGAAIIVWSIDGEVVRGSGRFWARALVEPRFAEAAECAMLEELDLLRDRGPTEAELNQAATALATRWGRRAASSGAWAVALSRNQALSGEPVGVLLDRPSTAAAITAADVCQTLAKYSDPERSFRIVVTPRLSP